MLICVVGDCHGKIEKMIEGISALEKEAERTVDLVLQVGDFGIWPDETRLDKATKKREGKDLPEFQKWFREQRVMPYPMIFIPGNHEDFAFLEQRQSNELLPHLTFLPWGDAVTFSNGIEEVRIGGVGGCYGSSDYERAALSGRSRRHYLRCELDRLVTLDGPPIDILLFHDAPKGDVLEVPPGINKKTSQSEGLAEVIADIQPRICFTGHFHYRTERQISGVRVVGLSIIPAPGCMLLIDFDAKSGSVKDVLEWQRPVFEECGSSLNDWAYAREPFIDTKTERAKRVASLNYPKHLRWLTAQLQEWAAKVLQGEPLNRTKRMLLYEALKTHSLHKVLMSALTKKDVFLALERSFSAVEAEVIVASWSTTDLPLVSTLRSLLSE